MWSTLKAALSARRVELLLFALLWPTYAYFYQSTSANGASRLDLTRAIIEDRTLHIDRFAFNSSDVIVYSRNGGPKHVYSNKVPGTAFLAVPSFWLGMHVAKVFGLEEWQYWHVVAYLTIISTVALLSALAAVAMYTILRRLTADPVFSALAVVAVWLGSICFPFSTLFFSHQQAAAQLVFAFYFLFKLRHVGPERMRRPAVQLGLAGFLCGFTLATEYPTILLVALLCGYLAVTLIGLETSGKKRFQLAAGFCAGLAIGGAVLVGYNLAAFGKIHYVTYSAYQQDGAPALFATEHGKGIAGVAWRGWRHYFHVLSQITVFSKHGLLYIGAKGWRIYACSPVLWLALPGLVLLGLRKQFRLEAILIAAMTVVYVLIFNACFGETFVLWGGAASVGPRHLIPLLPFLAIPLVEAARRLWFLFYPLLLISAFYMLLATAVEPRVPYEYRNPARDLFAANYMRGHLGLNREGLFDPQNRPLTADSTAFNLGKIAGLPGSIQLVPIMLLWLVAGSCLIWAAWWKRDSESDFSNRQNAEQEAQGSENQTRNANSEIPDSKSQNRDFGRFSPRLAIVVWALFVGAIAVAPPINAARTKRQLAESGGLLARFYPNARWQGPPVFVRKDGQIDFYWVNGPPLPSPFSVEWLGTIRLDRTGQHTFSIESDDGSFLLLDGKVVVNNGGTHSRRKRASIVEIKRRGTYPIAVRYFNEGYNAAIRVTWQPPGESERLLTPSLLMPPQAEGR